jgi:hypothetical protein
MSEQKPKKKQVHKLTPKQEGFAQDYILTGSASEAYRRNYDVKTDNPDSIHRQAHEIMSNLKVSSRIQELQRKIERKYEVTAESIAKEADEDRALARELGQPSAAVAALNLKARLFGLDKQVVSNDPDNPMPTLINVEIVRK